MILCAAPHTIYWLIQDIIAFPPDFSDIYGVSYFLNNLFFHFQKTIATIGMPLICIVGFFPKRRNVPAIIFMPVFSLVCTIELIASQVPALLYFRLSISTLYFFHCMVYVTLFFILGMILCIFNMSRSDKKISELTQSLESVNNELNDYYSKYQFQKEIIDIRYCDPEWLKKINSVLKTKRATTVNDALRILMSR